MPSPEQLNILKILVPGVLFLFGVVRPVYAVAGYMILVYCKASYYYPFIAEMHGELLFAILIIIRLVVGGNFFNRISPWADPINKYLYLFIGSVALSFLFAWDYQYSWDFAVYHFIKTVLLYFMVVSSVNNENDLKFFLWSFVLMFAYLAYEPVYGFLTGIGGSQQMYGTNYIAEIGILAGHVALANNMNQMIPLAWFHFVSVKGKLTKYIALLCLFLFLAALVGSGSRGGIVGLAVTSCCLVYFAQDRGSAAVRIVLLFLVLLVPFGATIMSTASRIDAENTEGRLVGLTHGVGILMHGNILGVGPGCYLFGRERYFSYRMEAHNLYGQIVGDLGIPGTIFWFCFMRQLFRNIGDVKKKLGGGLEKTSFIFNLMLGIQVSLIVRLVISLASHGLYYFYWYVLAAIVVSSRRLVGLEHDGDR